MDAELVQATTEAVASEVAEEPEQAAEIEKSIAVLPFVNMSDDASNEYFSEGLSKELLNLCQQNSGSNSIHICLAR